MKDRIRVQLAETCYCVTFIAGPMRDKLTACKVPTTVPLPFTTQADPAAVMRSVKGSYPEADVMFDYGLQDDEGPAQEPEPQSVLTQADLDDACSTVDKYEHWTRRILFTDGVKLMADKGGAYWLIDAIASYQRDPRLTGNPRLRDFQLWQLQVNRDQKPMARLTCREDTGCKPVITQSIEFTDFPLDRITLYVEGDTLLLPAEH